MFILDAISQSAFNVYIKQRNFLEGDPRHRQKAEKAVVSSATDTNGRHSEFLLGGFQETVDPGILS